MLSKRTKRDDKLGRSMHSSFSMSLLSRTTEPMQRKLPEPCIVVNEGRSMYGLYYSVTLRIVSVFL